MAKILIVDDNKSSREVLRKIFIKNNYQVIMNSSALGAIDTLKSNSDIDLLVSDIVMPEMDGVALIETLFNQLRNRKLSILIYSASLKIKHATHLLEKGVTAFLYKPFKTEEILYYSQLALKQPIQFN